MSGPTTACLLCNKATPLVGCWGRDASGRIGELCADCQPNRFVNPHYVRESAAAHAEALRLERSPQFAEWERELYDSDACAQCGEFSDWADGCSNGCAP